MESRYSTLMDQILRKGEYKDNRRLISAKEIYEVLHAAENVLLSNPDRIATNEVIEGLSYLEFQAFYRGSGDRVLRTGVFPLLHPYLIPEKDPQEVAEAIKDSIFCSAMT